MQIQIREGTIDEVISVYPAIPEFGKAPRKMVYEQRLSAARNHLILVAYEADKPIGFKVGYERDADGSFYSWMGGVAESHRRYGVAGQLLVAMQDWARAQEYRILRFKTRNYLTPMLIFGLKNGFYICGVEPRPTLEDYRILLQKNLY